MESLTLAGIAALALTVPSAVGASCELSVDPQEATAGTVFHVQGSGFTPTELTLQRDGGKSSTIPLELGGADPFDIPIGSTESDAGTWHVTAEQPGVCSASTKFVATLASTDVATKTRPPAGGSERLPLGVYAVVIGLGLGGGALAGRRLLGRLDQRRVWP